MKIEVVSVVAVAPSADSLYEMAVSSEIGAFETHFLVKRASEIRDFHDALQRELGSSMVGRLPSLPVLFEIRMMAGECQRSLNSYFKLSLNSYFSRLVCNLSAVRTHTFCNFFNCEQLVELDSRSPLSAAPFREVSHRGRDTSLPGANSGTEASSKAGGTRDQQLTRREEAPRGGIEGNVVRLEKGECTSTRLHMEISDTLARIQAEITRHIFLGKSSCEDAAVGESHLTMALEDLQRTNKEISKRLEVMGDCF
jgi:hypothetical protein